MILSKEQQSNLSGNKMSRSFLVDSLILKKSDNSGSSLSPPMGLVRQPSSPPAGHLPQQIHPHSRHHALHCFPRPPGSGGLLDMCCPWCIQTPTAASMPSLGLFSVPVSSAFQGVVKPLALNTNSTPPSVPALNPVFTSAVQHPKPKSPAVTVNGSSAFQPRMESHRTSPLRMIDPRRIRYMTLPGESHPQ
mgnify:CR=1 FL=1